jgi:cyclophilin family peptidyl-prolyl cis-trans isomerase
MVSAQSGKEITYRGCKFHRIEPSFMMQTGDFTFNNGSGGEAVINNGKKFKDDQKGLALKHDRRGVVSMGNSGWTQFPRENTLWPCIEYSLF